MILRRWLGGVNVDGGTGDLLFFDRIGQRDFIQNLAAGVVHHQQVWPALVEEPIAVEQMAGGVAAGDVECDDVDLAEELIEIADQFYSAIERGGSADKWIESDDGHLHC